MGRLRKTCTLAAVSLLGLCCLSVFGQACQSAGAARTGGWRSMAFAPHDGSVVELLETYTLVPWQGLFRFRQGTSDWKNAGGETSIVDSVCLYWRPFLVTGHEVLNGEDEDILSYTCSPRQPLFDPKKNRCASR